MLRPHSLFFIFSFFISLPLLSFPAVIVSLSLLSFTPSLLSHPSAITVITASVLLHHLCLSLGEEVKEARGGSPSSTSYLPFRSASSSSATATRRLSAETTFPSPSFSASPLVQENLDNNHPSPLPLRILFCLPHDSVLPSLSASLDAALSQWKEDHPPNFSFTPSRVFLSPNDSTPDSMTHLCDAIQRHHPHLVVSFLNREDSFVVRTVASSASLPLISVQGSPGYSAIYKMEVEIGHSVHSLSKGVLRLLESQSWSTDETTFIVDDSLNSQLLTFRLNKDLQDIIRREKKSDYLSTQEYYNNSSIKNSTSNNTSDTTNKVPYTPIPDDNSKRMDEEVMEYMRRRSRFQVIRISKNLLEQEIYLRMSRIMSGTHRVIVMHCDEDTLRKVVDAAHQLNLFYHHHRVWLLLDGVLPNNSSSPSSTTTITPLIDLLPPGTLALVQKPLPLNLPSAHYAIITLIWDAVQKTWAETLLSSTNASQLSSSSSSSSTQHVFETRGDEQITDFPPSSCWTLSQSTSSQVVIQKTLSIAIVKHVMKSLDLQNRKRMESRETKEETSDAFGEFDESRLPPFGDSPFNPTSHRSSWSGYDQQGQQQPRQLHRSSQLNSDMEHETRTRTPVDLLTSFDFDIMRLTDSQVPTSAGTSDSSSSGSSWYWRLVGNISSDGKTFLERQSFPSYSESIPHLSSSFFPQSKSSSFPPWTTRGGGFRKSRYRVVTAIAPPFVQESTRIRNASCLTGVPCLRVNTSSAEEIVSIFIDFNSGSRQMEGTQYTVSCCSGIAIDLLNSMARDLHFEYNLYLVADGLFGVPRHGQWDGITADLMKGVAHMAFTAFSVTSSRIEVIDYSVPFFYSGISCLSFSRMHEDSVPLVAFLVPFSAFLWTAIFTALFITAVAVAIYEWISPFGLNPWGRQRTKNFTLASAAWVMTSLLFSHLVAFKAPKSWPNKVLINVWAGFSVIFLATYTANIAAHFAGLFADIEVKDFHDGILMSLKTAVAKSSASEGYIMNANMDLWSHIRKNRVHNLEEGLEKLRAQKLDVLIGDTAILDYFRANDPGCNLTLLGGSIFDDAYAVAMQKNFPLKQAISDLIIEYNAYGLLDQLQRKWYGRVPCLEGNWNSLSKPNPLGIRAVAGVFIMLGCGFLVGILLLLFEHLFYKYFLPRVRKADKNSFWKSPNLMFFSQKLYRFVNSVELVSPHHSAKEIITNIKEGQITSLFQKSLKRKATEDARRRKSKSQFFEMIQEVRKVVHEQRVERSRGLLPDSLVTSGISTIDSSFSTSSSTTSSSASSFYSTSSSSTSSTTLGYKKRGGRGGSSSGGATIGMAHTAGKEMTSSRLRNNATSARIESLEVLQELEELEAEHVEEEEKEDVRDGDDDGREEKT